MIGKITDQTYADTLKTEITDTSNTIPVIGALPGLWAQAPLWTKIIITVLPFLLILLAVVLIYRKKKIQKAT